MPIIPNSSIALNTSALPDTAVAVNKTLTTVNVAEDLALVPVGKRGRKVSIVNDGPGSAFIRVDATATINDIEIQPKDAWYEDGIDFATKLSFIGETGKKPHVHGVVWCGL